MNSGVVLVTGGTGLVGHGITRALLRRGARVRALVRDPERAQRLLPEGIELAQGDILSLESIDAALQGVTLLFHAAGMPEQWQRDESIFDRVNRLGTREVLFAAYRARIDRVVYTSTMDVFAAPRGGTLVETHVDPDPKHTAYERSKQAADREADKIEKLGLDVVHVNPGAVYGPSPALGTLNQFFARLLAGKVPVLPPGGMSIAFVDGVADAHLAAADRGRRGERYLVADEHLSTSELARLALEATGSNRSVPKVAPRWLIGAVAEASAPIARVLRVPPLIAPGELAFLTWDARVDATKAKRELGFVPTPAREGIKKTIEFLTREAAKTNGTGRRASSES